MRTAKFKVELEIEVGYEDVEGVATTPYTSVGCLVNNPSEVIVVIDKGSIQNAEIKKFEREE